MIDIRPSTTSTNTSRARSVGAPARLLKASEACSWEGRPWRLIQTNLRDVDIDADTYVESLRWFKATIAMINTLGIIASYPSELDFHTPSFAP